MSTPYTYILLASAVISVVGTAPALLSEGARRYSWIAPAISMIILLAAPNTYLMAYVAFLVVIGILGIITLMRLNSPIRGVDYVLISIMIIATVLALYTSNLALTLLSLMLVSAPTYLLILMGDPGTSIEVGVKYVVNMIIATVLFFVGAIIISSGPSLITYIIGFSLLLLGLSLEVGVAPMHEWVPDVFTAGNPIPVSIIASIAKIAPFIVAIKITLTTMSLYRVPPYYLAYIAGAFATISMFLGNIGALTSRESPRVLAYSSIANMGYVMAAFAAAIMGAQEMGVTLGLALVGLLLQLFMNAVGKMGFFNTVFSKGNNAVSTWLISLAFIGTPPLLGFWSKLYIILALVYGNLTWLAVLLVINSVISVPYYVRLARELGTGWKGGLAEGLVIVFTILVLSTTIPPSWLIHPIMNLINYLILSL
ncbi:NADH-quinone oxidoreductase subunit N [Vulcanisaeta distributa]|uniref:NADH/Ubiquinone/plastoquinone (Complex I) n=1 Tax=Vulcanisaeta distributa (strain DSM 14429 / JCM 11212 / NBRC 100878 / IC-017) TaxID=572478 RepID=E1QPW4_VULDI|nr:NADH-quinone oxidoreductase subunit N [Vulcanisaeta distributa]ADN51524.1 NADH/Ubiquinone/plastoquinone (complex I) [Vulcanisaeta distributa DSM 14429]